MSESTRTSQATAAVSPKSYYPQILAAAEDPDFRAKDFPRLVLMQICIACLELREAAEHTSLAFKVGPLVAQIRTLRDLAATARLVAEMRGPGRCGQPGRRESCVCIWTADPGFSRECD